MIDNPFDDKADVPTVAALHESLRRTSKHWELLREHLAAEYQPLAEEWTFGGKKYGWSLRFKQKKRTILYLTPRRGFFMAGFALGEKAVKAAREARLPDFVLETIDSAPRYAEGRGVRLEVKTLKHVDGVKKLAVVKMGREPAAKKR